MRRFTAIRHREVDTVPNPLGFIKLGIKTTNSVTGQVSLKETPFFVLPEELRPIYGDEPTTLQILLPSDTIGEFFRQRYVAHLKDRSWLCQGDGETALRKTYQGQGKARTVQVDNVACPHPEACAFGQEHGCRQETTLDVYLPNAPQGLGGVYRLTTKAKVSGAGIARGVAQIRRIQETATSLRYLRCTLRRIPAARANPASGAMITHYDVQLIPDVNGPTLQRLTAGAEGFGTGPLLEHTPPAVVKVTAVAPQVDDVQTSSDSTSRAPHVDAMDAHESATVQAEFERAIDRAADLPALDQVGARITAYKAVMMPAHVAALRGKFQARRADLRAHDAL